MLVVALVASLAPPALPPVPGEAADPVVVPPPAAGPVRWSAPQTCPDGEAVLQRTTELLGRPLQPGELEVEGRVETTATGFVLDLRLAADGSEQSQQLEARECETLAQTAALIAAVLLDPVAAVSSVERQPDPPDPGPDPQPRLELEPRPTTVAPEPVARTPAAKRQRPSPSRRRVLGWARLRGGGSFGAVPNGTGGFEAAFALGSERLRGELLGAYWIGREVERGGATATVSLGHGTLRFCGLVLPGKVQIPLCAGMELGAMRADARDVPGAETRRGFWLAAHAAAGVRWSFRPRLSLWVEAQMFVPAVFPSFELVDADDADRSTEVYSPNPAGPRGLIGIEYKLF